MGDPGAASFGHIRPAAALDKDDDGDDTNELHRGRKDNTSYFADAQVKPRNSVDFAPLQRGQTASGLVSNSGGEKLESSPARKSCSFHDRDMRSTSMSGGSFSCSMKNLNDEGDDSSMKKRQQSAFAAGGVNMQSRVLRSQHTVSSLLAHNSIAGGLPGKGGKEAFAEDVKRVRERLHNINRRTINPRSRFIKIWDFVTIAALLFTAFVTPFEVAFFEAKVYSGPINFTLNRIVDAVFLVDIIISFFLPYRAPLKQGGMMVFDNMRIIKNYLRGWFALDAFTVIPFDLIFTGLATAAQWQADGNVFRLLRMLRILKLMRIVRASRIFSRWQDHVGISFAFAALLKFSAITVLLAHWLACSWGFIAVEGEDVWDHYGDGLSWRQKARVPADANVYEVYGISLYVALNNIFGGSCEINPANYAEFFAQSAMMMLGSSVWAYIIGSACGIVATLDPAKIEYRQTMDELNFFCRDQSLPNELTVKLRAYFRNTIHLTRAKRYEVLLQKMSTRLRGDAAYRMCEYRLRSVPFLVDPDLEPEFMCNLAIKYTTTVYSRLERVPCTELFIVERGVVAKRGRLGLVGTCFGKDVILSNDSLRDMGDAIALTFTQTISLSQKDIFDLLPDYPKAFFIVRKAALRMALIRALVKAANIVKRSKYRAKKGDNRSIIEMFDQALEEASASMQAEVEEKKVKADLYMPLTFGKALAGAKLRRLSNAAAGGGPLKPKGRWGKLGAQVMLGQVTESASAGAAADRKKGGSSPMRGVRLGNLIEKEKVKPLTVEENLQALNKRLDATSSDMLAAHAKVDQKVDACQKALLERMGALEDLLRPLAMAGGGGASGGAAGGAAADSFAVKKAALAGRNMRGYAQRPPRRVNTRSDLSDPIAGENGGDAAAAAAAAAGNATPTPDATPNGTSSGSATAVFDRAALAGSALGSGTGPAASALARQQERQEMREVDASLGHVPSSPFDA